jgi:3-hydroxyacyl-[acyl-carrier-protein] dehydratase
MLLNDFFTIDDFKESDNIIDCNIKLNINHPIYAGHFPSQPVVPGVCMMQILAELTSKVLGKKLLIKKANQVKFLVPIIPDKNTALSVNIKYAEQDGDQFKITGSIHNTELTFFKFKGVVGA